MKNSSHDYEQNDTKKKIFVFDLHDVLFKRNYWDTFKRCCLIKNKFRLFTALCNPLCFLDALALLGVTRVSEAYLVKLSQQHPKIIPFVDTIIDITNALLPIPHMFELIDQLKERGHKIYIFSNIGKKTFEKLNEPYANLFASFDGIHYVEEHTGWLAKPNHDAYMLFLNKFNIDPSAMVFIDDKNKNIKAAHALGITAFIYQSSYELIQVLKRYNLI
jgi:HAD superfamily hydrolase (TIGR01509 family)